MLARKKLGCYQNRNLQILETIYKFNMKKRLNNTSTLCEIIYQYKFSIVLYMVFTLFIYGGNRIKHLIDTDIK